MTTQMTMDEQMATRKALADAERNSYSPDSFPGSRGYMVHRAAARALAEYDAAHPELAAAIKAERDAARAKRFARVSDFTKHGS